MVHTYMCFETQTALKIRLLPLHQTPSFSADTKSLSVPCRLLLAFRREGKQSTYSFSWNFYMNTIAGQGPHLCGNLQCVPQSSGSYLHNHWLTHTSVTKRGTLSMPLSAVLQPVDQQLSPESKYLHMVSTFHNRLVGDVLS